MKIEERIAERKKIRAKQSGRLWRKNALKMLCAICDDYLEHRIRADKVQEGILKDIEGDIAGINIAQGDMNIRSELVYTFEKEKIMEFKQILNRAEGIIINAKSFAYNDIMSEAQGQLLNLKDFLNRELVNKPAESEIDTVDLPAEQPDPLAEVGDRMAEKMSKPAAEPAPEPAAESESKPGAGVVGGAAEPAAEQESAPGAGVVSKPEKSQNKDGSGVA